MTLCPPHLALAVPRAAPCWAPCRPAHATLVQNPESRTSQLRAGPLTWLRRRRLGDAAVVWCSMSSGVASGTQVSRGPRPPGRCGGKGPDKARCAVSSVWSLGSVPAGASLRGHQGLPCPQSQMRPGGSSCHPGCHSGPRSWLGGLPTSPFRRDNRVTRPCHASWLGRVTSSGLGPLPVSGLRVPLNSRGRGHMGPS